MIHLESIYKSFGIHTVLDGVTATIREGTIVGVIGPSGGGKSVLLKIMGQVLEPDQGSVKLLGAQPSEVSLMFQEGALFDSLSVFDNVAFPLVGGQVPTSILPKVKQLEIYESVMHILGRVGLADAAYKVPAQLSGGMRRRVSLARALVAKPKLVLLDDPTCGLDPVASSVIVNLIVELQHENHATTVIVSQDLRRLLPVVDRVLALFYGKFVFDGTLSELCASHNQELLTFVSCRYDLDSAEEDCAKNRTASPSL